MAFVSADEKRQQQEQIAWHAARNQNPQTGAPWAVETADEAKLIPAPPPVTLPS